MTVRYKGKDQIDALWHGYGEAGYGSGHPGAVTIFRLGYITELVPSLDPEIRPVYVLRTGASAGVPIALLSRRKNIRCRITWLQYTPVYPQRYWQHDFLKDPSGDLGFSNWWMEVQIKKDASNLFYLQFDGLKSNITTVRCSIGEPQVWLAECIGKSYATATSTNTVYQGASSADPWMWKDTYVQYDAGGGLTLFPDLTDYEFRFQRGLKPNFVFNNAGSLELASLEDMEHKATARLTANLVSKDFLDYLLGLTEVDLKLVMPDSRYIMLSDGKFRAVEPTIRPEDLIAKRLEFEAKSWSHGF